MDNEKHPNQEPLKRKTTKRKNQYELTEEQKEDPFNFLGFGMVAYRDLMLTLIWLFIVLSVIMLPAAFIYKGYDAINSPPHSVLSKYSLGNLGYSSTQCARIPYDSKKITLSCQYGKVRQIAHIGIIPGGLSDRDSCYRTE